MPSNAATFHEDQGPRYHIGPPDLAHQIRSSAWMTWGWTYQEGLLSRRRLFFSESEMSFECRDPLAREAIRAPPVAEKQMNRLINSSWIYKESEIAPSNNGETGLFTQLAEYTTRKMTYQSDVLSAMLGILQIYATLEGNQVYHVCGVPILLRPVYRSPRRRAFPVINENEGDSDTTDVALAGFFSGFCWTLRSPGVRRPGFPSWPWTRWHGEVEDRFRDPSRGEFDVGFNVEVSIVVADSTTPLPWSDYYGRLSNSVVKESRSNTVFVQDQMLEITANTITARFYEKKDPWRNCLEWKGTVGGGDEVCEGDYAPTQKGSSSLLGDHEIGFSVLYYSCSPALDGVFEPEDRQTRGRHL